jgi:hypothetical protein
VLAAGVAVVGQQPQLMAARGGQPPIIARTWSCAGQSAVQVWPAYFPTPTPKIHQDSLS